MPDSRPVWLTEQQINSLQWVIPGPAIIEDIVRAWDAAPADATEAIRQAIFASYESAHLDSYERKIIEEYVAIVLRSLGMPA